MSLTIPSALFGAERCLFGSNFPIEKLWTGYRDLVDAYRTPRRGFAPNSAMPFSQPRPRGSIGSGREDGTPQGTMKRSMKIGTWEE